jgi:hypothetical protein
MRISCVIAECMDLPLWTDEKLSGLRVEILTGDEDFLTLIRQNHFQVRGPTGYPQRKLA